MTLFASLLFAQVILGQGQIKFYDDLSTAQADSSAMKPYVLYFGATWCGPCKRMKSITIEALKETDAAQEYKWLKFDIDDSPEIAARYSVNAVPAIVVLDADQNAVGASAGFMTSDQLLKFVQDSLNNPQQLPPTINVLKKKLKQSSDAKELDQCIQTILTELTDRQRADRADILKLLAAEPVETQRLVLNSLASEPLAIRAAATEALTAYVEKPIAFDPFGSSEDRDRQLKQLRSKISLGE